jgi:glycosyltransferase involved in cell wall biosynthesis
MCLLLHLPLRCGGLNPVTTINGYRVQLRRKNILKRHAAVLVANSHMRREFAQNGVDPGKIHVVPLPLDEFNSQLKAPTPKKPSGKLLFMGRLTDLKGVHYLLRAISVAQTKLSFQLALTVAGEGPEEEQLRKAASQMNLKVNFAGWVGQKDLPGLLAQSDLLAVPSVWPEPFGLVGLEAASNGVPAVAFDVGGISSWLKAGVSGELAPGDPPRIDGLADAIVLALSDPNHYNHLRQGAWSFARQFAANHHVQKLESIMVRARSYAAARTQ